MGSCCSKRSRRNDSESHVGALHPSLENWKVRKRSGFSDLELDENGAAVEHMPVMWARPPSRPSSGFPSIHYNVNASLLCDSTHSSSRSLGTHTQPQFSSHINGDNSVLLSNQHIGAHHFGLSISSRYRLPYAEPENDVPPPFSFAAQPYIEPDFLNTAFAFHPPAVPNRASQSSIDTNSSNGIKFKVRHKHMFPQDLPSWQSGTDDSSVQFPALKRSRSHGKLPTEEGHGNTQPHRRSLQETIPGAWFDLSSDMMELTRDRIVRAGVVAPIPAFSGNDATDDSADYEDEDGFLDIDVGESLNHEQYASFAHVDEPTSEEIKYCISMEFSPFNKALLRDSEQNESSYTTAFKLQKERVCDSRRTNEWRETHGVADNVTAMQPLSVVSTGDAVLFSGSNLDELHLIPSRFVPQSHSPPTSPRVNLSPLNLTGIPNNEDGDDKSSNLSIEDIITLLETDDVNEDELLSLLINAKSPSLSPTASPSSPMLSISSISTSSAFTPSSSVSLSSLPITSSMSFSSSSSSSSTSSSPSSWPWLPRPSVASTFSQSLLSSMPMKLPFSKPCVSPPLKPLPQPSSRRVSPTSSFEFKVKSSNSAASTPMFSPIISTAKRNIAHLKPTALTTEEIAEIWGVFEQRQVLVTPH